MLKCDIKMILFCQSLQQLPCYWIWSCFFLIDIFSHTTGQQIDEGLPREEAALHPDINVAV